MIITISCFYYSFRGIQKFRFFVQKLFLEFLQMSGSTPFLGFPRALFWKFFWKFLKWFFWKFLQGFLQKFIQVSIRGFFLWIWRFLAIPEQISGVIPKKYMKEFLENFLKEALEKLTGRISKRDPHRKFWKNASKNFRWYFHTDL